MESGFWPSDYFLLLSWGAFFVDRRLFELVADEDDSKAISV